MNWLAKVDIFVWKLPILIIPRKPLKKHKKNVEVYSPFVMVTGMILSSDHFSNVTIDNGKVISDGDKEMVVGVAIPGLKDSLDLSDDLSDKIDIPESFTMEADVTDCSMENTFTMAVTDLEQLGSGRYG